MANKITRTIKTTTILYVIYGGNESEPQSITLPASSLMMTCGKP